MTRRTSPFQVEQIFDDGTHPAIAQALFGYEYGADAGDRMARGESIPGGPGACLDCGHAKVWHRRPGSRNGCEKCLCPAFTEQAALVEVTS